VGRAQARGGALHRSRPARNPAARCLSGSGLDGAPPGPYTRRVGDQLSLLRREFEDTRHRLIVTRQALTIAEQALEEIATDREWTCDAGDPGAVIPRQAREGLRNIHAVLRQLDRDVEKGS
jgi:hypothetical protein